VKRHLALLIPAFGALPAAAVERVELTCTPQNTSSWIRSVRIHVPTAKVWLHLAGEERPHEVKLLHVGPEQFGARTYHFNWTVEDARDPVVNAFKLFRTMNEWRLLNVGMEARAGTLVLRAIDDSEVMTCK